MLRLVAKQDNSLVYAYGFERPSSIQQCAIMPILDGQDVIAQASYGAGKTATLVISILQKVKPDLKACQTLILAPSRELVIQTQLITYLY